MRRCELPEPSDVHSPVSCKTLVLMSDLATVLDLQGHRDDALSLIQQAVDLSRSVGHPDQHVLLGNLAGILLHAGESRQQVSPRISSGAVSASPLPHAGHLEDAVRFYKEALSLAQQSGDQEAVDQILDGLTEVKKRRNQEKEGKAAED